ncbi:MAG: RidA family protein [Pseudomonadota bacterium]
MTDRINVNPPEMWGDTGFPMNQGVVEPAGRRVHVTGQVAWDRDMNLIGGDDAGAQTRAALENIQAVLGALGGDLGDIVSLTTYFVRDEDKAAITEARAEMLEKATGPTATGVRVAGLWAPDLLVELTAIAVIPESRFTDRNGPDR